MKEDTYPVPVSVQRTGSTAVRKGLLIQLIDGDQGHDQLWPGRGIWQRQEVVLRAL